MSNPELGDISKAKLEPTLKKIAGYTLGNRITKDDVSFLYQAKKGLRKATLRIFYGRTQIEAVYATPVQQGKTTAESEKSKVDEKYEREKVLFQALKDHSVRDESILKYIEALTGDGHNILVFEDCGQHIQLLSKSLEDEQQPAAEETPSSSEDYVKEFARAYLHIAVSFSKADIAPTHIRPEELLMTQDEQNSTIKMWKMPRGATSSANLEPAKLLEIMKLLVWLSGALVYSHCAKDRIKFETFMNDKPGAYALVQAGLTGDTNISDKGKDFLLKVLGPDDDERPSPEEALKDTWFLRTARISRALNAAKTFWRRMRENSRRWDAQLERNSQGTGAGFAVFLGV